MSAPDINIQIDEMMTVLRKVHVSLLRQAKAGNILYAQVEPRIANLRAILKTLQYVATHRDAFMKAIKEGISA